MGVRSRADSLRAEWAAPQLTGIIVMQIKTRCLGMPALRGSVVIPEQRPQELIAARAPRSDDHRDLGEELAEMEGSGDLNTVRLPGKGSRR